MIYAVGDIHGQVTMLKAMLELLPLNDEDILLFIGDYIDRGENSRAVIETLMELKATRKNVVFLRGNHEQMALDAMEDSLSPDEEAEVSPSLLLWLTNGGVTVLTDYGVSDVSNWTEQIPEAHWDFLKSTELEYITDSYHFVHAGLLVPGKIWEGALDGLDYRLWIREPFLSSKHNFNGRTVIFGHTPQTTGSPLFQKNKIGIDTGAVFGGPLSAIALDPSPKWPRRKPQVLQIPHIRQLVTV